MVEGQYVVAKRLLRLLVVDSQYLSREGLRTILGVKGGIEVVGMASNGLEAIRQVQALVPDVVLTDISMPVMDGIACIKHIKAAYPHIAILILTSLVEEDYIVEGLASGASGYIPKDIDGDKLAALIRDAASGRLVLQGVIASKLVQRLVRQQQNRNRSREALNPWSRFTEREAGVARLIIKGLSNREIAEELQITEGTVRNYVSALYAKLEVGTRAEAIVSLLPGNSDC